MATDNSTWINDYVTQIKNTALDSTSALETAALNYFNIFWNNNDGDIEADFQISQKVILDWNPPSIPDVPTFILQAQYEDISVQTHLNYVWTTDGSTQVKDAIWNIIYNNGIGISQALQDSLFNADRERKLLALNDALTLIAARTGGKGFRKPTSVTAAQENEAILKYQFDLENQSREITKLMEEHARTNMQFATQQGIAFETFHADFANKYDAMFLSMKKTAIELYVSKINAEIAAYEAYVKGLIQKVELAKAEAQYFSTVGNVLLDKYKADIQQATAKAELAFRTAETNSKNTLNALTGYANSAAGMLNAVGQNSIQVTTAKLSS